MRGVDACGCVVRAWGKPFMVSMACEWGGGGRRRQRWIMEQTTTTTVVGRTRGGTPIIA